MIVDVILDGEQGDRTIRPCSPERRAALEAERENLRRWREEKGDVPSDCVDVILDGEQGDRMIRPCSPERRAALEAERENLRRWREASKAPVVEPSTRDSGNSKESA
jgi:hypothetical protein